MDFKTPLAKATGLGSAKSGTTHWWMQRVSAVAMIPLTIWLLIFLQLCLTATYQETLAWLASPLNSVCLLAWILSAFHHAASGMQVVVEDYVGNEGAKIITVWVIKLSIGFLALAALLAEFRTLAITV